MQVADHAPLDPVPGLPVLDVVVPLVADRQVEVLVFGRAGHLLALADVVGHELFGDDVQPLVHRRDGNRRVQVQRRGDDDRLDAVGLGVGQKLGVRAVDLDVLLGFGVGLPAVDRHQPRADRQQRGPAVFVRPVAVKGAELVVGADIGDGFDLDVLRVQRADEHAAFIARADHADADRRADGRVVAEIEPAQAQAGHGDGRHALLEKDASGDFIAIVHALRPSNRVYSQFRQQNFVQQ